MPSRKTFWKKRTAPEARFERVEKTRPEAEPLFTVVFSARQQSYRKRLAMYVLRSFFSLSARSAENNSEVKNTSFRLGASRQLKHQHRYQPMPTSIQCLVHTMFGATQTGCCIGATRCSKERESCQLSLARLLCHSTDTPRFRYGRDPAPDQPRHQPYLLQACIAAGLLARSPTPPATRLPARSLRVRRFPR